MASPAAVDRRRLLQLAAASAGGLWLPRGAWSQPRLSGDPFGLGVASGSPAHDSVVLWTRLMAPGTRRRGRAARRSPCAGKWPTTSSSAGSRAAARRRPCPNWRIRCTSRWRAWSPTAGISTASWPATRSAPPGAPAPFPRPRRAGAAAAPGLRVVPALGARLFQRLPPHARGEPGRGAVPGRLHLRVPDRRRARCGCPPAAGS